jgi:hypothetical protein
MDTASANLDLFILSPFALGDGFANLHQDVSGAINVN